jgi:hypothetical protein
MTFQSPIKKNPDQIGYAKTLFGDFFAVWETIG